VKPAKLLQVIILATKKKSRLQSERRRAPGIGHQVKKIIAEI
jgi:hypothetical protein